MTTSAVFLDRDGVLIEDTDLLTSCEQVRICEGIPQAIRALHKAGLFLVIVSNQTVVARGLATEEEVHEVHEYIQNLLYEASGVRIDCVYFCPHHPSATLPGYRVNCDCRKPRPGMLVQAARKHNLNLQTSFLVGDRITDIVAGARAGCRTVLVQTGKHEAPPIETVDPLDESVQPDHICGNLRQAAEWILGTK